MKKINSYGIYFLIILFSGLISSCNNDEIVMDGGDLVLYNGINPKNNYAYILDTEGENEKSIITFTLQSTPKEIKYTGKSKVFFQAGIIRPETKKISLNVIIDETLVEKFNKANNSNYKLLPKEGYKLLKSKATIKATKVKSDSIKFTINDKFFTKSENYVLPVKIKSDKSILTSNNKGVVYFTFSVQKVLENIETVTTAVAGTSIERKDWSITASSNNRIAKNMLDDDNSDASEWWTYANRKPTINIDMKKEHTVKGITIIATDGWLDGKPKLVSVATSIDGKLWTIQGETTNTDISKKEFFIKLKKPMKAQYLRMQILKGNGGYIDIGTIKVIE